MTRFNHIFVVLVVFFILQFAFYESIAQTSKQDCQTYENTRQLLLEMSRSNQNVQFSKLFSIGDERISDLVKALNDSDEVVRRNAQVMIRYLGNDKGMASLLANYQKRTNFSVAGPIPLPLREWDYDYIRKHYQENFSGWDILSTSYIYALYLDSSPRAKSILNELIENARNNPTFAHQALEKVNAVNSRPLLMGSEKLPKSVLDNAFFVSVNDKKFATSKLISFNGAKDKALIEIQIIRGILSEEYYHIVVKKHGNDWKFFSITQIAVS
jgi:hypothetical protein